MRGMAFAVKTGIFKRELKKKYAKDHLCDGASLANKQDADNGCEGEGICVLDNNNTIIGHTMQEKQMPYYSRPSSPPRRELIQ